MRVVLCSQEELLKKQASGEFSFVDGFFEDINFAVDKAR